jgi:hypothetical protein
MLNPVSGTHATGAAQLDAPDLVDAEVAVGAVG